MNTNNSYKCGVNDSGRRIDRVVKKLFPDLPAGRIYSAIRKGLIRVNGKKIKQDYRIHENDEIKIDTKIKSNTNKNINNTINKDSSSLLKKITILRNENLIVINKPAGLLTHGNNSLAEILKNGLDIDRSLSFTPAPLHRLDRNTSGLIVASSTLKGAQHFSKLIKTRNIKKFYIGICKGEIRKSLRLVSNLSRDRKKTFKTDSDQDSLAITNVQPLLSKNDSSVCLFQIETGRTHQIRSQISEAGYPLSGDKKYNGHTNGFKNYFLHSFLIILPKDDPICGFRQARATIPDAFTNKLQEIFEDYSFNLVQHKIDNFIYKNNL